MRMVSKTLLLFVTVIAAGLNLHCNDSGDTSKYNPTAAYIRVHLPGLEGMRESNEQEIMEAMEILQDSYVSLAKVEGVLRRAINEDNDENGIKLDRIRKTSYFVGDLNETIENLERNLLVTAIPGTNLISISVTSGSPSERAMVANAVADALVFESTRLAQRRRIGQMKSLTNRLEDITGQIAAKQKSIEQIRGQSETLLTTAYRTALSDSLVTLYNKLTSLRLQKARTEADLGAFKEGKKSDALARYPEIRSAIANDPIMTELRAAILNVEITALGDKRNKQLPVTRKMLEAMLADRQKNAAREVIELRESKLRAEVASIHEGLLVTGNQYNEESARLKDLGVSLRRIEELQSGIARFQQHSSKVQDALLRLSIFLAERPVAVEAYAEAD